MSKQAFCEESISHLTNLHQAGLLTVLTMTGCCSTTEMKEKMSSLQSLHNLTNSCEFAVNSERMQYFHNGHNTAELFQMQCL